MQINRYDAEGLRYEIEENGKLVQFIFNAQKEAVIEKSQDNLKRLIRSFDLWASECTQEKTWYHYASDEQGSIVFVTDGEEIKNRYEYDAWGNAALCDEKVENRYRYTGQQYDPVTQQYYLRARYYNPVIARFTQEDEYRGDGLNLYAYCANNPVVYFDPSGYVAEDSKDALGKEGSAAIVSRTPRTLIDNQVKVIQQAELPPWVRDSFKDRKYTTVQSTEDILVYRTFGGRADAGGAFVTTEAMANRIQATERLALLPEWGNSRMYEAIIKIPEETILNVGKVAGQTTRSGGILSGGADQVLLPQNWPLEWIQEIRLVPSR